MSTASVSGAPPSLEGGTAAEARASQATISESESQDGPQLLHQPTGLVDLHSQLTGASAYYGHLFSMSGALAEAFDRHIERRDLTAPLPNNITKPLRQSRVFRFVLSSSHATSVSIG